MQLISIIRNFFSEVKIQKRGKLEIKILPFDYVGDINYIIAWPPNIFLILYHLVEITDKYRLLVSQHHESFWNRKNRENASNIKKELAILCDEYYDCIGESTARTLSSTPFLEKKLNLVFSKNNLEKCVYDLFDDPLFRDAVFELIIGIDDLFGEISHFNPQSKLDSLLQIRPLLGFTNENIADNDNKLGVVTYKSTTPQTGLNINNLTHNLTFIKPSVKPKFVTNRHRRDNVIRGKSNYNLLLLPWPLDIDPRSFSEVKVDNNYDMHNYFGFFSYTPIEEIKIANVLNILISSIKRAGNIDIIVFPESAMDDNIFNRLAVSLHKLYKEKSPMILAGVYGNDDKTSKNVAKIAYISEDGKYTTFEQTKHHRWFLEKNQLRNYNLSNALDPSRKWWEHIGVGRRNLVNLLRSDGLKLCPLICEDLARQEPVAQAVRAIGPNLVISLLLDGPQLSSRWPGKYAAVLADDPGSSVLSLTALGMTMRSTGLGFPASRGVALWSEPGRSSETLELEEDCVGLMLELEMKEEIMWSLDGREKSKPVLRKIVHTSLKKEYPESNNLSFLSNQLQKELENVLKW